MLRYGFEIFQELIKMFVRTNKRFPNPQENKFLQNQALRVRESLFDRGVNMEELSAEDAIKVFSKPPKRRKPPTAEIYKPLEFGKKSKPKEGIEALDEAKVFDQFRDENTLTNLYRTQEQALAGGDIDTSRKIQKQIDAIINKEPLSDFADGGRVGFMAGGISKIKKLAELAKKTKSSLGKAPKTDVSKVKSKVESDKKSIQELADDDQIPVRDDTVKVKGETLDDGTPDYEYYSEILDDAENQFVKGDETLEQLEKMVKDKEDYMSYMYGQYKTGKLDPKPGEVNRSRLNFLKDKAEEAEMSGRSKIISPDEIDELNFLEKKIRKTDLDEKVQDLNRKLTDDEITELKDLDDDPGMFDDLFDRMFGEYELDKLKKSGRKPNANGGLATLFEEK